MELFLNGQSDWAEASEAHDIFLKSRILECLDGRSRPPLRSLEQNYTFEENEMMYAKILNVSLSQGFDKLGSEHMTEIFSSKWLGSDPAIVMDRAMSMKHRLCVSHTAFSMVRDISP